MVLAVEMVEKPLRESSEERYPDQQLNIIRVVRVRVNSNQWVSRVPPRHGEPTMRLAISAGHLLVD